MSVWPVVKEFFVGPPPDPHPENQNIQFWAAGGEKPYLKIWYNRTPMEIEIDPALEPNEAAKAFWDVIRQFTGRQK